MVPGHHGGSTRTTTAVRRAYRFIPGQQQLSSPLRPPTPRAGASPRARVHLSGITDFMGHLRRLMKELYEAGFCFKECIGLVDNFRITTSRYPASTTLPLCVLDGMEELIFFFS